MSTVILPLFHFKVAQCGIYSKTTAFRRNAAPPPLSGKALNFKWLEDRCQAICISAQHQEHLKVENLDGVLSAATLTFTWKGKLTQTNSPHSLSQTHHIHFHDESTLTFPRRRVFPVCGARAPSLRLPQKRRKETCLGVINPHLFGLLTLTFPHIPLPLSFFFFLSVLLSLSPPRWHVDSSLLVGISFQWAGWWGWGEPRDVVIISISGCLAAFPSACWQTLAIEQLSGREGVGCGLRLHRSRSFLSKSRRS